MGLAIKKIIATTVISVLSFLGWEIKDDTKKPTVNAPGKNIVQKSKEPLVDDSLVNPKTNSDKKENQKTTTSKPKTSVKKQTAQETKTPSKTNESIQVSKQKNEKNVPQVPSLKTSLSFEDKIKNSVANIYCLRSVTNGIEKITGSASAVAPGIYLTNAHVALYVLLENSSANAKENFSCFLRTGSPAKKMYKTEIVYFPESWVNRNVGFINSSNHIGTGEKDYAIIKTTTFIGATYPSLSSFEINLNSQEVGDEAYLTGYPAPSTAGPLLDSSLHEVIQKISLTEKLNFGFGADAFSTSPSLLAENGSSGGALVDLDGKLTGIMVATTIDPYSGKKNIRAITTSYINKDLQNDSGHDISWYIQNATSEANNFKQNLGDSLAQTVLGKSF